MAYWTLQQVKDRVNDEIDLEFDTLVQPKEFVGYVNAAVRRVVAVLARTNWEDKYFRTYASLNVVANQAEYDFPADCLKNKITEFIYNEGNGRIYPIRRLKGQDIYSSLAEANYQATSLDVFNYTIFNFAPGVGDKICLVPTPKQNYPSQFKIYYIRQAQELSLTDDGTGLVDCPEEFIDVVIAYVKWKCTAKELGNPMYAEYKAEAEAMIAEMDALLTGQTEDGDNKIPLDKSFYGDHT